MAGQYTCSYARLLFYRDGKRSSANKKPLGIRPHSTTRHRHRHRHPRQDPREDVVVGVDVGVVECGLAITISDRLIR